MAATQCVKVCRCGEEDLQQFKPWLGCFGLVYVFRWRLINWSFQTTRVFWEWFQSKEMDSKQELVEIKYIIDVISQDV